MVRNGALHIKHGTVTFVIANLMWILKGPNFAVVSVYRIGSVKSWFIIEKAFFRKLLSLSVCMSDGHSKFFSPWPIVRFQCLHSLVFVHKQFQTPMENILHGYPGSLKFCASSTMDGFLRVCRNASRNLSVLSGPTEDFLVSFLYKTLPVSSNCSNHYLMNWLSSIFQTITLL